MRSEYRKYNKCAIGFGGKNCVCCNPQVGQARSEGKRKSHRIVRRKAKQDIRKDDE